MIPKNIENKEIGLLGLGVSGKSAFKSLKAGGGKIYAEDSEAQLLVKSKFHPTIKPAEFIKLQLTCCN